MAEPYNLDEEDENNVAAYIYQQYESDEEEEDTEGDTEEEDEDEDEVGVPVTENPISVSNSVRSNSDRIININDGDGDEERIKRRRVEKEEEANINRNNYNNYNNNNVGEGESSQGYNRNFEIDGLFCPICMDAWTSEGDHRICCLPCGHLFGLSCITKWLKQNRSKPKCPQCNTKFTLKDIRKLFAPRLAVVDEESQKTIRSLEVKCAALEKKGADWCRKESEWQKSEADLQFKINQLTKRANDLERLLRDSNSQSKSSVLARSYNEHSITGNINSSFCSQVSSGSFVLERELPVDGARLFDIDVFGQIILLARKLPKIGSHVLTKMNLLPPHESDNIFLPSSMKVIKDLHISPFNQSHVLCASLGKKLSVLSMESNSVVLSCDLPAPAWSCSWDINNSHYIYAGLQNGSLMAFDMRKTGKEVDSRSGLTNNPIHTLHSLNDNSSSGFRRVLSASSIGICQWNFDSAEERPFLISETENQGVCISLAYCPRSNDVVATYRPKVEVSSEFAVTQPSLTPSPVIGQGVWGSHLHLKRKDDKYQELGTASATVSNIRLPKSVIIEMENQEPLFSVGDEATCGMILQELPSFRFAQRLKSHKHPICDVKCNSYQNLGLLGCLSEDTLQLYSSKHS